MKDIFENNYIREKINSTKKMRIKTFFDYEMLLIGNSFRNKDNIQIIDTKTFELYQIKLQDFSDKFNIFINEIEDNDADLAIPIRRSRISAKIIYDSIKHSLFSEFNDDNCKYSIMELLNFYRIAYYFYTNIHIIQFIKRSNNQVYNKEINKYIQDWNKLKEDMNIKN